VNKDNIHERYQHRRYEQKSSLCDSRHILVIGVTGISTINIPVSSAVDDDSCANQMEQQERSQDEFEDTDNPNNDKGNLESWTNSFKNREPC
jgi:hypothetical protein